jgi:hypothetical protein
MRWFAKNREVIIPYLVVLVAGLLLANLIRHGILTASLLSSNKDALAALQSAVQIVFIIVGSIFSYYRFFRGRTFVSRADLSIRVDVIETTQESNLHYVTIEFKNLGTISIWNPTPTVSIYSFGPEGIAKDVWDKWREAASHNVDEPKYAVVDSGETVYFSTYQNVSKRFWAVEYAAFVSDSDGMTWKRSLMVANKPKDAK